MKPAVMPDGNIIQVIEVLQEVQRTNKPTSKEWQEASRLLNELFKEMAHRRSNDVTT